MSGRLYEAESTKQGLDIEALNKRDGPFSQC
jgi:hypothetical protein